MYKTTKHRWLTRLVVAAAVLASPIARADVVTDGNITATDIVVAAGLLPPPAWQVMALAQAAVYEAVNTITKRYPGARVKLDATPGASVDAAVAAANRAILSKLLPAQQAAIDRAYQAALSALPDGPAKTGGITIGEQAAAAILTLRADDGTAVPESYRPHTTPGLYVPTVIPIVSQWPQRQPWVMTSADQFRPGPPPSLTSALWARDYNELKALGAKTSTTRSAAQTAIAGFWESGRPSIYLQVVRAVATAPGREVTQNARLFAAVTQAMDDALIAIFDAKYHYNFWRPITAIRNGDTDSNDATERDPSWTPFIDTPMHPEYPCAHCILAATVGTLLQAEIGTGSMPTLTTTSDTAQGVTRSWTKIDDLIKEVAEARICDGVHYRTSTEVGTDMGKKLGQLVAAKYFQPPK